MTALGQLPKDNWWEVFGDPELSALETQASAANQQLKAAVERFAEANRGVEVRPLRGREVLHEKVAEALGTVRVMDQGDRRDAG